MSNNSDSHLVSRQMTRGWGRPSRDQKSVLLIGCVMCAIGYVQAQWLGVLPIAFLTLLLYAPEYGRKKGYRYSGIEAIYGIAERRRLRKRGNVDYSFDLRDTLLTFESESYAVPPVRKSSAFPAKLISIVPQGSNEQFAFLRDKGGGGDHIVAVLLSDGGPKFTNSDLAQRFMWDTVLTSALKRGVNTTLQSIELSQFVIARQADTTEPVVYANERWHDDFLAPVSGSVEEKLGLNAVEDAGNVYRTGKTFRCGVAIRMAFPRQWRSKDLNDLTLEQITSTEFMSVVETIRNNLSGAVTNLRLPSLFELNEIVYLLFNSEDLGPFYVQQRQDIDKEMRGDLKSLEDAATLKQGPFPGHISIFHDFMQTNKTQHTSVGLLEFETGEYAPGYLDSLFAQPFPFVYSHYLMTYPHKKGLSKTRRNIRGQSALSGFLHSRSSRELHLEDQEAEAEANRQHFGLFYSKSRATLGRIQMTVQGGQYEETQARAQLIMGSLSHHSVISRQLLGEPIQVPPLLAHLCLFDE